MQLQVTVDQAFAAFRDHAHAHHYQLARLAREIADGAFDTSLIPQPDRSTSRG